MHNIMPFLFRSPGGTPLKTRSQNTSVPVDNDPAAIIAHALQRKFSHSVFSESPGLLLVVKSLCTRHGLVQVPQISRLFTICYFDT